MNPIVKRSRHSSDSLSDVLISWYAYGSIDLHIKLEVLDSCKTGPLPNYLLSALIRLFWPLECQIVSMIIAIMISPLCPL